MDNMCNGDLIAELIAEGQEWFDSSEPEFNTGSPECEAYLRNLEDYPHFFVLACIMDRGVPAERAWRIPFQVCADIRIDGPEFKKLLVPGANDFLDIFRQGKLHRYGAETMSRIYHSAVQLIQTEYQGDASAIWSGIPRSATVIRRLLQFDGVGPKIATMATNILAREFKVPLSDLSAIDISSDIQVKKFLQYHNFVKTNKNEEAIYWAREHYPDYPGIFDHPCWRRGRELKGKSTGHRT